MMTVQWTSADQVAPLRRETLNPLLEEWYNRGGTESPRFIPVSSLVWTPQSHVPQSGRRQHGGPEPDSAGDDRRGERDGGRASGPSTGTARETAADQLSMRSGLDSLDRMDLTLRVEDRFGFHSDQVANDLGELWRIAEGMVAATKEVETAAPELWTRLPNTEEASAVLAENLAEAFLRRALRHLDDAAVADRCPAC